MTSPMEISLTGMDVEWRRLETIAANLANASTAVGPDGLVYQPMVLLSGPRTGFGARMDANSATRDLGGVMVYSVEPSTNAPKLVYQPGHPQADTAGYVAMPDIDHAGQMTLMVRTARAYEANLVAMSTASRMYAKALELGNRA